MMSSESRLIDQQLVRSQLNALFRVADFTELRSAISDPQSLLNQKIPGLAACNGCDQGTKVHLEGDAAVHTAWVILEMRKIEHQLSGIGIGFVDYVAAAMHDVEKPSCRVEDVYGNVSFPGHEARAADRVPEIALLLGLNQAETATLHFVVAEHGSAHSLPKLPESEQKRLAESPFVDHLVWLQSADAAACHLPGGGRPLSHWDVFSGLKARYAKH